MLGQLKLGTDNLFHDKVELAIQRLKAFCPPDGYYVAFSGGKDSQCVYHLCKMAGVNFDAHYNVTSVDPPELVQFIKSHYPDVIFDYPRDRKGNVITMWKLIPQERMPPTRLARYCCEVLKETNGEGRYTVTGVRQAESANRKRNQGVVTIPRSDEKLQQELEEMGANVAQTPRGGLVLNYDDSDGRRMAEHCIRTGKVLINPIIDWEEDDVWEFLNGNGIEHCCLYDEGYTRLGCIGCPMKNAKGQKQDFERWPKYRKFYESAFQRMIDIRKERGLTTEKWETPQAVFEWWLCERKEGT